MNCEEMTTRIQDYLDRVLPPAAAAAVAEHLRQCPDCQAELDACTAVERLLQDEPFLAVPHGFADRVMTRVNTATQPRRSVGREYRWIGAACAAAVLLAAAAGLFWPTELAASTELPGESVAALGRLVIDFTDDVASARLTVVESGGEGLSVATLVGAAVLVAAGLAALRLIVEPRTRRRTNQRTHYRGSLT